jgi:hypothetical protein
MVFFGESSLRRAVDEFMIHYNQERNHQGLASGVAISEDDVDQISGDVNLQIVTTEFQDEILPDRNRAFVFGLLENEYKILAKLERRGGAAEVLLQKEKIKADIQKVEKYLAIHRYHGKNVCFDTRAEKDRKSVSKAIALGLIPCIVAMLTLASSLSLPWCSHDFFSTTCPNHRTRGLEVMERVARKFVDELLTSDPGQILRLNDVFPLFRAMLKDRGLPDIKRSNFKAVFVPLIKEQFNVCLRNDLGGSGRGWKGVKMVRLRPR